MKDIINCDLDISINGIKTNSKDIKKGDCFVCIKGINEDRHNYIDDAIKRGASCLVVEKEGNYSIPFVKFNNANKILGEISKRFYDDPCSKLKLIGITGTDGKTTTASIIRNMIGNNMCGYIGTNGVYIKDKKIITNNTTNEINVTYKYLDEFIKNNLKYASMEISSESLLHNRTNTLKLDVAIITNITQDHLNVHKSIDNYIESKKKILELLKKDGVAIINRDDKNYDKIINNIKCKYITYGKNNLSDLIITDVKEYKTGTIYMFKYKEKEYKVISPLLGIFNVYNLCSSILALKSLGFSIDESIKRVTNINNVSGRCEILEFGQKYRIVLDYAHTENALKEILDFLNKTKGNGKIITITGSAGGREKEKRKTMGKVVLSNSDLVIFTMDDPRYENVEDIINDMLSEYSDGNYIKIYDREVAIKKGLDLCDDSDTILIAGKGRDNYMAIEDKKIKYCDYDVIEKFFKE